MLQAFALRPYLILMTSHEGIHFENGHFLNVVETYFPSSVCVKHAHPGESGVNVGSAAWGDRDEHVGERGAPLPLPVL